MSTLGKKHNFSEEDQDKTIEFLNFIAQKAKFEVDTKEIIKYFGLLTHMQKVILPKIDSHILEIKKVVDAQEKPTEKPPTVKE